MSLARVISRGKVKINSMGEPGAKFFFNQKIQAAETDVPRLSPLLRPRPVLVERTVNGSVNVVAAMPGKPSVDSCITSPEEGVPRSAHRSIVQ